MSDTTTIIDELRTAHPQAVLAEQPSADGVPTAWIDRTQVRPVLGWLKSEVERPYRMLFDLTAIDERVRAHREGQPPARFTVVYRLISFDRNSDVRLKVALADEYPALESVTDIWPMANWYEREVWDMFGIRFEGHPHLRRILMPAGWKGHPLRKEHPSRATEMEPYQLPPDVEQAEQEALRFEPEAWGMKRHGPDADFMFLNLGPHHPGTHGVLRLVLQLAEEEIVDMVVDIGYHHRGKEKIGERQTWHSFIPYTDRVDYLAGVLNNLAYLASVESLAGIDVPDRAKVIRVMLCELFRIASHLVWYGTFAQDLGLLSAVFYMFTDRERIFSIIEAVCGGRMHPSWFRIGGVAADLPKGWDGLVRDFVAYMPGRLAEYDKMVLANPIFQRRTRDVGRITLDDAIEWGATGPILRACGLDWDFRKRRPYSGYEWFEFDIPTGRCGDSYDRGLVRVEEIRQSLRIIEQCLNNMPGGPYQSDHPLATPPRKDRTMHDIETLITHFLNVSWGPVIPPGEACPITEGSKGAYGYYLVSDGSTTSYRTRIRTPSFAHMQLLPLLCRGWTGADVIAILGSVDYVLADVDR
jgi:NADH-quinone oxidoreductase subunit C/D